MTDEQIRQELMNALANISGGEEMAQKPGRELPDDFRDILDSFGFVQLMVAIEHRLGIELDMEGADLEGLMRQSDRMIAFVKRHVPVG